MRLDSTLAEFFINDESGVFDWDAVCTAGYQVWAADVPTMEMHERSWLDFMVGRTGSLDTTSYDPPLTMQGGVVTDYDQVRLVVANQTLPERWWGGTPQYPPYPPFFRGPSGCIGTVKICYANHVAMVHEWVRTYELPESLEPWVLSQRLKRTFMHEMGHALGIDHHDPLGAGSHDCVMKYETADDYNGFRGHWEDYTWGQGYLPDSWNCLAKKGLRPSSPQP